MNSAEVAHLDTKVGCARGRVIDSRHGIKFASGVWRHTDCWSQKIARCSRNWLGLATSIDDGMIRCSDAFPRNSGTLVGLDWNTYIVTRIGPHNYHAASLGIWHLSSSLHIEPAASHAFSGQSMVKTCNYISYCGKVPTSCQTILDTGRKRTVAWVCSLPSLHRFSFPPSTSTKCNIPTHIPPFRSSLPSRLRVSHCLYCLPSLDPVDSQHRPSSIHLFLQSFVPTWGTLNVGAWKRAPYQGHGCGGRRSPRRSWGQRRRRCWRGRGRIGLG